MPLNSIKKQIMDYLYSDTRIMAGGTAYAAGWDGATRERYGVAEDTALVASSVPIPSPDFVNLFDKPYEKGSKMSRPGVYFGTPSYDVIDEIEFPTCTSDAVLVEMKEAIIPVVIDVDDQDFYIAADKRDQLLHNIRVILADHIRDAYWYELRMPGKSGGGELSVRTWSSGTSQYAQGGVEAMAIMPVRVRYQWSKLISRA